jgi:hypothetical protein
VGWLLFKRVGLQNNPGYRKSCSVRIFFSEQHQVLNEQTIIQKKEKTIKPDRMVVTKDKEVFLDYKTGLHDLNIN